MVIKGQLSLPFVLSHTIPYKNDFFKVRRFKKKEMSLLLGIKGGGILEFVSRPDVTLHFKRSSSFAERFNSVHPESAETVFLQSAGELEVKFILTVEFKTVKV